MSARSYLSIGDVLSLLREEFPDVTISKIRFLESQGLVNPQRTVSGYRKFYDNDVKRLRWVLRQQREHFLPLKVIRDRLDSATDDGNGTKSNSGLKVIGVELNGEIDPQKSNESLGDQPVPTAAFRQARAVAKVSRIPALMTTSSLSVTSVTEGASHVDSLSNSDRFIDEVSVSSEPKRVSTTDEHLSETSTTRFRVEPSNDLSFAARVEPLPGATSRQIDSSTSAIPTKGSSRDDSAIAMQSDQNSDSEPKDDAPFAMGQSSGFQAASEDVRATPYRPESGFRADRLGVSEASEVSEVSEVSEASGVSMTLDELCLATGLQSSDVNTIESFGLISPSIIAGTVYYDESALLIANLVADFSRYGIEPRHLRLYKNAADRELGLIEQVVSPLLRQRNPKARQQANESSDELAELGKRLRASLISRGLRDQLGR